MKESQREGWNRGPFSFSHPSYLSPQALNLMCPHIHPSPLPLHPKFLPTVLQPGSAQYAHFTGPVMTCAINPLSLSHPLSVTHTVLLASITVSHCPYAPEDCECFRMAWHGNRPKPRQLNTLTKTEMRVQCLARSVILNLTNQCIYFSHFVFN